MQLEKEKMISDDLLFIIKIIKNLRKNVTQLELHKLLYMFYCSYRKEYNKELFSENFEAWLYGPVIREVYYNTNKENSFNTDYLIKEKNYNIIEHSNNKIDIKKYIKEKYEIIKKSNVINWVAWTHEDDCWKNTNPWNKIDKKMIEKHHDKWEFPWELKK